MTIPQPRPSAGAAAASKKPEAIWVDAAVRVIAAGVRGGKARATLVLTPILASGTNPSEAFDLNEWPLHVARAVAGGVQVAVSPVKNNGARPAPKADAKTVAMVPVRPLKRNEEEDLVGLWASTMGGDTGFGPVKDLLARDDRKATLKALKRPMENGGSEAPDIHGVARGEVAIALTLENAKHIIDRLACKPIDTRPAFPPAGFSKLVDDILCGTACAAGGDGDLVPGSEASKKLTQGVVRTDLQGWKALRDSKDPAAAAESRVFEEKFRKLEQRYEEEVAWKDLAESRARTDADVLAYDTYLKETDLKKAVAALKKRQVGCPEKPTPGQVAIKLRSQPNAGPALQEAHGALRLASEKMNAEGEPLDGDGNPVERNPDGEFALRRLFALQAHPSLARLFHFVVDVECNADAFRSTDTSPDWFDEENVLDHDHDSSKPMTGEALPAPGKSRAGFVFLAASLTKEAASRNPRKIWTTAKLRAETAEKPLRHFYPCAREEIDARLAQEPDLLGAAIVEQIDGIVHLGQSALCDAVSQPRFDIAALDTITSTAADMQFEKGRRQRTLMQERNRDLDGVDPAGGDGDPLKRATLRTGGLALIDRYRQRYAVTRYIVSAKQIGEGDNAQPERFPIVLDASDLTVGYRLDVGVKSHKRRRWHSLMNRDIVFGGEQDRIGGKTMDAMISSFYSDSRNERRHADAAAVAIPVALRQPGLDLATATRTTAFTEELVASWEGDPLGVACRADVLQVDPHDLQIGMVFSLPNRATDEAYVPPPLRFGWRYHFGLRAVWAGGIAVPLERALGHYERSRQGTLALPAIRGPAAEGRAFRRHERLAEPMVAIPGWAFGVQMGNQGALRLPGRFVAEQAREMVIRKVQDPINKKLLQRNESEVPKEKDFARRVLMVPSVSLAFAGLHDAFRAISRDKDIEQNIELPEPYFPAMDEFQNREPPLEGDAVECIETVQPDGDVQQRYIYWRKNRIANRPRGGLRGVDRRASWGGFPVYEKKTATGEGEIAIDDPRIVRRFVNGKKQSASKLAGAWHPLGGAPHGDAVFRALPAGAPAQKERLPYYPDPAADALVISVSVAGRKNEYLQVPVYKGPRDKKLTHPSYPDALPLVLDVKAARNGQPLLGWAQGRTGGVWSYGADENLKPEASGSVAVHHVVVSLAPGEEATIRAWCLPGKLFLQYGFEPIESIAALCVACGCVSPTTDPSTLDAACRDGFASLAGDGIELGTPGAACGPAIGGLPLPTQAGIDAIAKKVETFMKTTPIPEIASPLTITATYAVDIPQEAPVFPLPAPAGAPPAVIRVKEETRVDLLKTLTRDAARGKLKNWNLESTLDGATDVLLTGEVKLHAASTGTVEFIASGVAAARGRFDDADRGRPRDSRLRGLWPEISAENPIKTEDLFGFKVSGDGRVTHPQERVPLLRIEAFGAGSKVIDTFLAQRKAAGAADATADEPRKTLRHEALTDGRARYLTIEPVAVARHGGLLRTRYDELMEQQSLAGQKSSLWLPACVRPARIAPRSLIPSFSWPKPVGNPANVVSAARTMMIRARMRRPWFSSGEGERLGVVLWPPRLFSLKDDDIYNNIVRDLAPGRPGIDITKLPSDGLGGPTEFQDGDLGPGGSWVTRWGADPTRISGDPHTGWLLSRNNFPQAKWPADPKSVKAKAGGRPLPALYPERDPFLPNDADWARAPADAPRDAALVQNVLMPLPSDEDDAAKVKPVRFMTVALVTYEARFDAEREEWYADIEIDVPQAPWPFVRLGLVRFQPHAPRHLQVSEPVAEWIQLMPRREAQAVVEEVGDTTIVSVIVTGAASARGDHDVTPERASAQAPLMRVVLLRKNAEGGDRVVETYEARIIRQGTPTVWEQRIKIPTAKFRNPDLRHAVYVEEVERFRPATYPDEPRRNTTDDEIFVETGPRFAVRLELLVNQKS
uniref:Uncharacterized protein n=1 Tax=Rhodopseudomonas palustris (strain BisA53) TaxID=316055 RepID=Q07JF1_RHOP5